MALVALGACAAATPQGDAGAAITPTSPGEMGLGTGTPAAGMPNAAPFDAQFIDSMIEHHEGAISMAQEARQESERPEIDQLAGAIISAQQREIEQMRQWREDWYPGLSDTGGMSMPMGDMEVMMDHDADYDAAFIEAMIAHHEGAIAMAREALNRAEHAEIRQLAAEIIEAQEGEIEQLQQWSSEWYGE